MKMMTRILCLVFCLVVLVCLFVACDSDELPTENDATEHKVTEKETPEAKEEPQENQPHEHVFGEWQTVKDATCTELGVRQRACTSCEKTEQEDIPMLTQHVYVNRVCACGALEYSVGLAFAENGDGTSSITGMGTCTDTVLYLPPTAPDGSVVTKIADSAFLLKDGLTEVVVPDSVTSIGAYAFYYCSNLANITLPDSVTSIGGSAFSGTAYDAETVNWTDGVLYLGNHLIKAKSSLSGTYTVKDGTKTLATYAFQNCMELTGITLPEGLVGIGDKAFQACTRLRTVTLPESLLSIGKEAFSGCAMLTSMTLPASLTEILPRTFYECTSLKKITLSNNITSIGESAFRYCTKLTDVYFMGTEEEWKAIPKSKAFPSTITVHYDC